MTPCIAPGPADLLNALLIILCQRSNGNDQRNPLLRRILTHFIMHLCFLISKLKHVSHDRNGPAALHFTKHVDSCLHGNRIGIIAVIHNGHIIGLYNVAMPPHRLIGLDSCLDLLQRKSQFTAHSRCCQCIGDHMTSRCRYRHRDLSLRGMQHKPATCQAKTLAVLCINRQLGTFLCLIQLTPIRQSIKYRRTDTFVLIQCAQLVIISV